MQLKRWSKEDEGGREYRVHHFQFTSLGSLAILVNIRYFFPLCDSGKVTKFIYAAMSLSVWCIAGQSNEYMLKTSKTCACSRTFHVYQWCSPGQVLFCSYQCWWDLTWMSSPRPIIDSTIFHFCSFFLELHLDRQLYMRTFSRCLQITALFFPHIEPRRKHMSFYLTYISQ